MADNDDHTRTSLTLVNGALIEHYRIVEKIGAGGMGEVYLAEDTKLSRKVALKFLPYHFVADSGLRARFVREAQAAAKLDHPNIITVYEVSESEGRPFIAMQFIDGRQLTAISQDMTLTTEQALKIMGQICSGLGAAHQAGIIHRDIKSANIIIDKELRPKILDFGLAAMQGSEMITRAGSTLGTVTYMSPEQAQGREIDHRSDLFSLGIVMYELLAGRTPFKRANDAATLHAIISDSPEPLARYKSDIPDGVQRIVSKALAKSVDERYQTAADISADLNVVIRALTQGERATTGNVAVARPSIAVLPLANMSRDEENEFFADGLTEELLNMLAKNPGLRVTGRTSSFAFKGKQEDLRSIGQKLGVGTILEGSVRKAGNRVRITTQLVNVADGFHLWSETYDRVLDDIFAVQDDIAKAVSTAMHVTLVGVNEVKKPVNPESYSLILRAHHSHLQMNKEGLQMAVDLYKKAIEIDPENAKAWAGLSSVYGVRVSYGHGDYAVEFPLAKKAAERALALDDSLAQAHETMSFVYAALELRMSEGRPHMLRAFELAPNDSAIVSSMALWEMLYGNFDRAIKLSRRSIELDPLNPWSRRELGRVLTIAGHLGEAHETMLRAQEMSPDMTTIHLGFCYISLLEGKFEEALSQISREKIAGYRLHGEAMALFSLGRIEDSNRQLESLIAEGENWAFQVAGTCAWHGEIDKAFEWLERAYDVRDAGIPLTKIHPLLKSLHPDPRWEPFLSKIGLAD